MRAITPSHWMVTNIDAPVLPPNPARRRHASKLVTTSNLCLPSVALAWCQRRSTRKEVLAA